MEKQKNLFLHWINIYHSEILTNLVPAIEGLQADLAMYTELTVILNLDRFTVDSILTYGSMAIIPLLVISVQYQKTGFGFYNSLNICLDCGYFHIVWNYLCWTVYLSMVHKLIMAIYASFSRKMLKTRSTSFLLWWEMNSLVE